MKEPLVFDVQAFRPKTGVIRAAMMASALGIAGTGALLPLAGVTEPIVAYALYGAAALDFVLALALPPLMVKMTPRLKVTFLEDRLTVVLQNGQAAEISYDGVAAVEEDALLSESDRAAGLATVILRLKEPLRFLQYGLQPGRDGGEVAALELRLAGLPAETMPFARIKDAVQKRAPRSPKEAIEKRGRA